MASPLSVGDCIAIIDKAIDIYNKIKDAPKQIEAVKERMDELRPYMSSLQQLMETQVAHLSPNERNQLNNMLGKIKADVEKIKRILDAWRTNQGPGGFTLRFDLVKAALFAFGSSPKELQDLTDNIDRRRTDVMTYIALLNTAGINKLLNLTAPRRRPSKSPARKEKYSIIFIDAHNKGRSIVAQAYAQLVREWTLRTKNTWRIDKINSAGVLLKAGSATVTLQKELGMTMMSGGKPPIPTALAALFDNGRFNFPYKEEIRQKTALWTSRGLPNDLFTTYDFILLFNTVSAANLERLKEALVKKRGKSATENDMGEIVMLGEYGKSGSKEIWDPPKDQYTKDGWNKVMSNIKVSFKEFLKKETGWIPPQPGAKQD